MKVVSKCLKWIRNEINHNLGETLRGADLDKTAWNDYPCALCETRLKSSERSMLRSVTVIRGEHYNKDYIVTHLFQKSTGFTKM